MSMVPVGFDGCAGSFHAGHSTRGVVLCSSFGFEEIAARKSMVLLAHLLAARGVNVLRFDYFGTGDSLGGPLNPDLVATWRGNVAAAADWLKTHADVTEISLVGLRLGGLIAAGAAASVETLDRLVLVAPPASGKAWLREGLAFSGMMSKPERAEGNDLALSGYRLTNETAAAIKALDWSALAALECNLLVMAREQTHEAEKVAAFAGGRSDRVEILPFVGYAAMMCDPTASVPPMATLDLLAETLAAGAEPRDDIHDRPTAAPPCVPLAGPDFVETQVRIGIDGEVGGVLCLPAGGEKRRNVLVFFNAGGIPRTGWARMHVDMARKLARFGTTSLRIDLPGLGDSALPGGPSNVAVISQDLSLRICAIVDWLKQRGFVEIALVGSCSGAYHAFRTALTDPRIDKLVLLNQGSFFWSAAHAMKLNAWQKSKAHEMQTTLSAMGGETQAASEAARLMTKLFPVAKRFARGTLDAMMSLTAMANVMLSKENQVEAAFRTITSRGGRIMLVYSEGDAGLAELDRHFGDTGLDDLPGVEKHILANADHLLTQPQAREAYSDLVARFVDQRSAVRTDEIEREWHVSRAASRAA